MRERGLLLSLSLVSRCSRVEQSARLSCAAPAPLLPTTLEQTSGCRRSPRFAFLLESSVPVSSHITAAVLVSLSLFLTEFPVTFSRSSSSSLSFPCRLMMMTLGLRLKEAKGRYSIPSLLLQPLSQSSGTDFREKILLFPSLPSCLLSTLRRRQDVRHRLKQWSEGRLARRQV